MLRQTMGALVFSLAFAHAGFAQPSVTEGNKFWSKPDMEEAVRRMEIENPIIYEYRHAIVAALGLEPGQAAADVGAGTGFITRLMAHQVGPSGKVYAQDISQEALDYVVVLGEQEGITNIERVLGDQETTNLPESSADLVVTIRAYHHFMHPEKTLASIHRALRPGGRFVVIEPQRIRGVSDEFTLEHVRAGKGTFTDEIVDAGFALSKEIPLLPANEFYFLVFEQR